MSKKKKVAPVVRPPTKRQLTRWQKQKRQQKIIFGIGAVIVAAIVILVGSGVYFGWYVPVQLPLRDVVLEVNGASFTARYFIDTMKYQLTGVLQGNWTLSWLYMDYVTDMIINSELLRYGAENLGITVSEAEVDEYLLGHSDNKNPALRDMVRTTLLTNKLREEHFAPQLPLDPEQRQALAMLLESQTQLDDIKAQIEAGDDFGELAKEHSLNAYTKNLLGDLGFRPSEAIYPLLGSTVVSDAIFNQTIGTLGQVKDEEITKELGYWIIKVTEKSEDGNDARISGILLGSEEEASMIKARLDNGEDFLALCEEYSQDWDEGKQGSLGQLAIETESILAPFVFDPETKTGDISSPIKDTEESVTTGGYWLIKVLKSENRPLVGENRVILLDLLFNDWWALVKEETADSVTNHIDEDRSSWIVDYLTGALV